MKSRNLLRKVLLGGFFLGSIAIVIGAYITGGVTSVMSQVYIPLGLLLSIILLNSRINFDYNISYRLCQHIVFILFLSSFSVSIIIGSKPILLVISFPLGIIAAFLATSRKVPRQAILIAVISLVSLQVGYLVLLSGIYVGNFDPLWQHYEYVSIVTRTGSISDITGLYSFYPGLFIFGSIVSSVTGLSFYPSSIILLIIFTSVIVVSWYMLLSKWVTKQTSSRAVLISCTLIPVLFHFMVFFPQNMAFALLFPIFAIISSKGHQLRPYRLTTLVVVLTVGVLFTHHYSFLLLSPLALLLVVINWRDQRESVRTKLLALPWITSLSYAVFIGTQFITTGIYVFLALREARRQSTGGLHEFGTQLHDGLSYTLAKIIGPFGIHYTLIVAGFVIGSVGILAKSQQEDDIWKWLSIFAIGCVAGGIILPSSPAIKTSFRLSYALAIIFSLVVAIGIRELPSQSRDTFAVLFIAGLAITAPVGYAGDVPQINPAQSYSEQRSYTDLQVEQFRSVAEFSQYAGKNDISASWLDRELLELYGAPTEGLSLSQEGVHVETEFVITRTGWDSEKVNVEQRPELAWFIVANSLHDRMLYKSDMVYSSGRIFVTSPKNSTLYRG